MDVQSLLVATVWRDKSSYASLANEDPRMVPDGAISLQPKVLCWCPTEPTPHHNRQWEDV